MTGLVHSFRPTVFSRERHYQLHDEALLWTDDEVQRSAALRDVASVRIYRQSGAGLGPTIRRAVLLLRSGDKVVLQSTHYVRFGVIEDRAGSYRAFVGALLERIVAANPQAKVIFGHSWLMWTIWLAVLIGAVLVLAGSLLLFITHDFPLEVLLYLGIIVAFLPVTWRVVSTSRPRVGNPQALPAGILD